MLLKNNTKSVQQFSLTAKNLQGVITPRFLQIPAGATVEVDDADWRLLVSSISRVQIYESSEEPIGTEEFGQAKLGKRLLTKKVKNPTGRYRETNLVLDLVKSGRLQVLQAPKSGKSVTQLINSINLVKGLSVNAEDFTLEELEEVYMTHQHAVDEAVSAKKALKEA